MKKSLEKLLDEYNTIFSQQKFNPDELDYSILKYHIGLLETFDVVDSGCISIYDLYQRKHIYYSPKYEKMLGWDTRRAESDVAYTNSLIHPEDLPLLVQAAINYIELGFSIRDESKLKDYKAIFDYRVIGRDGRYTRIIEQQIPLEIDKSGNVWLALSMMDLSPENDINLPFRGRLKNHRTGELFYFPTEEDPGRSMLSLTSREKEILGLIARGLISKEIADKLYISVNTVNTHRQRIIEKLNVSNTYEAIRYANERGLFS
jgi:DNA-binding CsgD family transcriptional regulator